MYGNLCTGLDDVLTLNAKDLMCKSRTQWLFHTVLVKIQLFYELYKRKFVLKECFTISVNASWLFSQTSLWMWDFLQDILYFSVIEFCSYLSNCGDSQAGVVAVAYCGNENIVHGCELCRWYVAALSLLSELNSLNSWQWEQPRLCVSSDCLSRGLPVSVLAADWSGCLLVRLWYPGEGHECAAAEVPKLCSQTGVPYMCQPLKHIFHLRTWTLCGNTGIHARMMHIFDGLFCWYNFISREIIVYSETKGKESCFWIYTLRPSEKDQLSYITITFYHEKEACKTNSFSSLDTRCCYLYQF